MAEEQLQASCNQLIHITLKKTFSLLRRSFSVKMKYFTLFFLLCYSTATAQFLDDAKAKTTVSKALEKMYNEEWTAANTLLEGVHKKYSTHPVSWLLKATELQLRYTPIESYPIHFEKYMDFLYKCNSLAEEGLKAGNWKEEFTFYMLASCGYIAQSYHHQKEYLKAVAEGRRAYSYMKDGFGMATVNPDFYFTNGLYRYYRERYPETHPTIKPFIVFFAKGNKSVGIADLHKARNKAVFTKTEASMFLVGIFLKYENDPKNILSIASELHTKYPRNQVFYMRYIESLIALDKNDLALSELRKFKNLGEGALGQLSYYLFLAQITQKKNLSQVYYAKALQVKAKGRFVEDYRSMAYVGLVESFLVENDKEKARQFLKEAEELAEYTWVKMKVSELKRRIND